MPILLYLGLIWLGLLSAPAAAVLQLSVPNPVILDQQTTLTWNSDFNDPQSFSLYADRLKPAPARKALAASFSRNGQTSGTFPYIPSSSNSQSGTYQVVALDGPNQIAASNQFEVVDPNANASTTTSQTDETSPTSTSQLNDPTSQSSSTTVADTNNSSSSSLGQTSNSTSHHPTDDGSDTHTSNINGTVSFPSGSPTGNSQDSGLPVETSQESPSQTSSPSNTSTSGSSSKSHTSTIIGATIGAILGLAFLGAAAIFALRRHRRKKNAVTFNREMMVRQSPPGSAGVPVSLQAAGSAGIAYQDEEEESKVGVESPGPYAYTFPTVADEKQSGYADDLAQKG